MVSSPDGLDIGELFELKHQGRSVAEHDRGVPGALDRVVDIDCDIWIPAARPDVLRADNVSRLSARIVVQGANIPATAEAEAVLRDRGIVNVPDFIANAGGVICAAMEYRGSSEAAVFDTIGEKIRRNTESVLEAAARDGVTPRAAAHELARERVARAMAWRRWNVFSSAPGFL